MKIIHNDWTDYGFIIGSCAVISFYDLRALIPLFIAIILSISGFLNERKTKQRSNQ